MEPQFQTVFEQNLLPEQRRAVLRALSRTVPQDATVGDLVEAARALGWSDPMITLSLQDFANALLGDDDVTEHSDVDDELEEAGVAPEPSAEPESTPAKPTRKRVAAPAAGDQPATDLEAVKAKLDADEPMSLDEAAQVLVPIVANMETATMQQLEALTGIGRRKLRFHIGQLVRNEYLERHGMGRGTYYTACE